MSTLDNIETTLEVIEDRLDDIDAVVDVVEVVRNNPKALVGVGVLGVAAGAGLGYFAAVKRLRKQFDEELDREIQQTKEFYSHLNKVDGDGELMSPKDVLIERHGAKAAAEALRGYQGRHDEIDEVQNGLIEIVPEGEPHDEVMDEAQIEKIQGRIKSVSLDKEPSPHGGKVNVFVDDTFDLEEEQKHRTEDKPYIITHDEFFSANRDYDNLRLTYYEVDETLCDEQDVPMTNLDGVGEDHLVRFGSGSKDKNIVYIRNEKLEIDYEIVRSTGSYLEEVLGMDEQDPKTLKHSDQRDRRRAIRSGDG